MLRLQLDAHPQLAIPPETGFGLTLAELGGGRIEPEHLLDAIIALPTWPDLGMLREDLAIAFAGLRDGSAGAGLRAIYRAYARRHGKSRWGDKTPAHAAYMDRLAQALPEARFIHLIRDGRDVAASIRGLPFAPGDGSLEAIASAWRDGITRAQWLGATLPHYREVRYERLVTEPEATLRELCDLIELEFDQSMLRAHERARARLSETTGAELTDDGRVRFAGGGSVVARSLSPPDPSRAGRWRDTLSAVEVARFETVAGPMLGALGYEPSHRSRSSRLRGADSGRTASGRSRRMRVILGTHRFADPGGTESYIFTVARELQRLGHEPIVASEESGAMADYAERNGIPVARAPVELPKECDAIFPHDAISAAGLVGAYPRTRLVYFAHSDYWDHQLPPLLEDGVAVVIAGSDRVAARVRALAPEVPIVRLRQPIDIERFVSVTPIRPRPQRALLLSNYLKGARQRTLVEAWEGAGVECVQIGAPTVAELDVVPEIARADIVVAKARAAIEGMSCARAVYVYDEFGGDGWVTPDNYAALEADNFAGQATPRPRTVEHLVADLAEYRPEMGWVNRELARTHHGARKHAIQLVECLRGPAPDGARSVTAAKEFSRLTRVNLYSEGQASAWRQRAIVAEREVERSAREVECSAREVERSAREVERTQRELEVARSALAMRRVRAGLAAGRVLDRIRRLR